MSTEMKQRIIIADGPPSVCTDVRIRAFDRISFPPVFFESLVQSHVDPLIGRRRLHTPASVSTPGHGQYIIISRISLPHSINLVYQTQATSPAERIL